jgi:type IV secretory pathway VirJ component
LALNGGRYGDVHVVEPDKEPTGYVIFFSDRTGWQQQDEEVLTAIAQEGAIAIGVDLPHYYAQLAGGKMQSCEDLVGDAEGLARQHQHELHLSTYEFPILAGAGEGGALATRVLAQAPGHTLSGVAAIDPSARIHAPRKLCPARKGGPFGFHETAQRPLASPPGNLAQRVAELLRAHLIASSAEGVASLPLEELPVANASPVLAVVLSGDGGWRDLDRAIAENLQRHGVSVIGWDCLRYFWHMRTPDETAQDLAMVLRTYGERWHAQRFALIGYSFGADVLPTDAAVPIAQELAKIPAKIIQCMYGVEETDTICPALAGTGVELVRTSGGHHFDKDYDGLARRILARLGEGAKARELSQPTQ